MSGKNHHMFGKYGKDNPKFGHRSLFCKRGHQRPEQSTSVDHCTTCYRIYQKEYKRLYRKTHKEKVKEYRDRFKAKQNNRKSL